MADVIEESPVSRLCSTRYQGPEGLLVAGDIRFIEE